MMLHDKDLLYCISIAKFEGNDFELEVLAHVANGKVFLEGTHIQSTGDAHEDGLYAC